MIKCLKGFAEGGLVAVPAHVLSAVYRTLKEAKALFRKRSRTLLPIYVSNFLLVQMITYLHHRI